MTPFRFPAREMASADFPLPVAPQTITMGVMDFVITLIADANKLRLPQAFVDSMVQVLSMQDVSVSKTTWLKESVAVDLFVSHDGDAARLDATLQDAIRGYAFDAIVQPVANRKKKLLVADMESTMVDVECLDELAKYVGLEGKISAITKRAMNGEIDFAAALAERVGLLKGLPETALQEVYDEKVKPMPGAKALMAAMKKNGGQTLLVTGGFDFFARRVADMLGFDEYRANKLEIIDGKLTGKVTLPILDKDAKLAAMQEACKKLAIKSEDVLAIGDGANDLPMLLAAGLGVAYHAKPVVQAQAKARINHADLSALVYAQGLKDDER
jgi:phosphoserine phosphatase